MKKNVVVIGSGIAGSLICNELAKKANVTLLEAGEENIIQYPPINFVRKALAKFRTFCLSGGGGSNLWHNGLIPINKVDVTSRDFSDVLVESRAYINTAATNLFFADDSYENEYAKVTASMQTIANEFGVFPDGIDCLLYPKSYKKLSVSSEVKQYYSVDNIAFNSDLGRVTSVDFNVGAEKHSVICDLVIVSAGTYGSPRLVNRILASLGIKNKQSSDGLIDHPAGFVGKVKFKKNIVAAMEKFAHMDHGSYTSCTGARIKSRCGNYTGFAFFRPALTMGNSLAVYQYKSLLAGSRGIDRIKNALSFKLFHPDILLEVISHIFGFTIKSRTCNILIYFQQRRGNNNVTYSDQVINIDWGISNEELVIYNEILKKLESFLGKVADGVNIQSPITEAWLRSGAHHSGTVSLGAGDDCIIDKNLKIHQCENAYVCDGSVIQEHSYANTGLTIGQMALRLVNHLVK